MERAVHCTPPPLPSPRKKFLSLTILLPSLKLDPLALSPFLEMLLLLLLLKTFSKKNFHHVSILETSWKKIENLEARKVKILKGNLWIERNVFFFSASEQLKLCGTLRSSVGKMEKCATSNGIGWKVEIDISSEVQQIGGELLVRKKGGEKLGFRALSARSAG